MKHFLFLFFFLFGGAYFSKAMGECRNVPMYIINTGSAGNFGTQAPPRPWFITQDENILTLSATPVDYELQLIDEMGNLVYSAQIPAGTTQITLPTSPTGSFELRLVADTYYYRGYIEL